MFFHISRNYSQSTTKWIYLKETIGFKREYSNFKAIKHLVSIFTSGIKQLGKDTKKLVMLKKKRKFLFLYNYINNIFNNNDKNDILKLTREEFFILRQIPRDLVKAMPLISIFLIPLFGYISPLIGFKYPRETLPMQFWTEDQRKSFLEKELMDRIFHIKDLSDCLKTTEDVTLYDLKQKDIKKHLQEIIIDDYLLIQQKIISNDQSLSKNRLQLACMERMIKTDYNNMAQMKVALSAYLSRINGRYSDKNNNCFLKDVYNPYFNQIKFITLSKEK